MGYFKTVLKGVSWVAALRGGTRVIAFVKTIVIARILLPSEYGLFSIAFFMLAFLEVLTETGVNTVLLQKKQDVEDFFPTALSISILRAILIAIMLFLTAPLVATFFKMPQATTLIRSISLVSLLRGFINPSVVLFQKNLEFARDFILRVSIFAFDAVVAVYVTYMTDSPMGLVWGLIAGVLMEILLSYLMANPRTLPAWQSDKAAHIIRRGKWMTGAGIFQFLFREGDDAVVGRLLGSSALGLYQMAYKIATLPISEIADVIAKVTLPVFVKIGNDSTRLKKAYLKTTLGVSTFSLLFGASLIILAEPIVGIILGENWLAAVPALQVVSIYAMLRASLQPSLTLLISLDKQEDLTAITLFGIMAMFVSIFPLTRSWGIVGAGMSTIIGVLAQIPVTYYYVKKNS